MFIRVSARLTVRHNFSFVAAKKGAKRKVMRETALWCRFFSFPVTNRVSKMTRVVLLFRVNAIQRGCAAQKHLHESSWR